MRREQAKDRLVLAALVLLSVGGNGWWVLRNRRVLEIDLDEATLLMGAERVRAGLFDGWFLVRTSAPLVRTVTAGATAALGRSPLTLVLPILVANAVLLVSVSVVARQLGARRWSLLAAALVAVSPGTVMFSRSYHQVIPGAAALAACVAVAIHTEGFRRRRPSIALGAAIGVALLTRAMLVAFVPVVILAAVVEGLVRAPEPARGVRVVNLLATIGTATLVSGVWWVANGGDTFRYLRDGPSPRAGAVAPSTGFPGERELHTIGRSLAGPEDHSLRWALVLVLVLGVLAVGVHLLRSRPVDPPVANVTVFLALSLLILVANSDGFPGFILLVLPVGVAWSVAVAVRADAWPQWLVLGPASGLVVIGVATFLAPSAGWYAYGMEVRSGWSSPSGAGWVASYRWALDPDARGSACPIQLLVLRDHQNLTVQQLQWTATVTGVPAQLEQRPVGGDPLELRDAGEAGWFVLDVEPVDQDRSADRSGGWNPPEDLRRKGLVVERQRRLPDGSVARRWRMPGLATC